MMYQKIIVHPQQIALLYREQQLKEILPAGVHIRWGYAIHVEHLPAKGALKHDLEMYIRQNPEWLSAFFHVIDVPNAHVALRYQNDQLMDILPPLSRQLWFKTADEIRVEYLSIQDSYHLPQQLVSILKQPALRNALNMHQGVLEVSVPDQHMGLIFEKNQLIEKINSGYVALWTFKYDLKVRLIDMRIHATEIVGQEMLSRDKVTLRVNLIANWQYHDPELALRQVEQPEQYLYRELQFALREIIGTHTLDELLEKRVLMNHEIAEVMHQKLSALGLTLHNIGIRDIILPGEIRQILNQVVEAEKAAQANNIRRREETAATRSLLNTAKVMENNPIALRLKELETLEGITKNIDRLSVYSGLDGVLNGLLPQNPAIK